MECLSEVTKIAVKKLKTEMTFQSLVPVPSLMPCAALERKQRNCNFNDINELM